jgi:predicted protein tyrosine phosphatase
MEPVTDKWVTLGHGIYLAEDTGGRLALIRDRACSEKNLRVIAAAMNVYPRYNFMTKALVELLKEDPAVVKTEVARILQTIGITPPNVSTTAVKPLG